MNFDELNLVEPILKALQKENYTKPTPIQAKSIPIILDRKDVLGSAQTGTGKTAAFAIPILQHLYLEKQKRHRGRKINALVITPTRELAIQIGESFTTYGQFTGLKNTVIFGGVNQNAQANAIKRGVDILVATPGRLLDLIGQGIVKLNHVEYFVLDEADNMLDMGFIHDIRKIIAQLPTQRQSMFFSATMPDNIVGLSRTILSNPVKVEAAAVSSTADTIEQRLYYTNRNNKAELLAHIIDEHNIDQVLVFCRTKHGADRVARNLNRRKIKASAIHGDKAQNARQRTLQQFKDKRLRVLVATDIAARGIDIDQLTYVINYDMPNVAETYVHRIGRGGRAGDEGIAISISEPEHNTYIRDIEKLIDQKIEVIKDHPFPQTDKPMTRVERQAFEKEKNRKRQEFFAARRKKRNQQEGKKKVRPRNKR